MNISALRFNSASVNQIAQAGQDRAIIVVGGRHAGNNSLRSVLDRVALNPQPLPPKEAQSMDFFRRLSYSALNPQPLPPQPDPAFAALGLRRLVG